MSCNKQKTINIFIQICPCTGSLVLAEHVFVKLTLFFYLKNKPSQTKVIPFSESVFKIKVMLDTFLDLADISSQHLNICDKVFKNGSSKICRRQPLKGCLPQILLGPFLNTYSYLSQLVSFAFFCSEFFSFALHFLF